MANRDLIRIDREIHNEQVDDFIERLNEEIESGKLQHEGEILYRFFSGVRALLTKIGKPTMKKRYVYAMSPPRASDINETFREIHNDTRGAFSSHRLLGEAARLNFNYGITERLRLRNKIRKIGEMVNNYIVTAKNTISRLTIIRDTFVTMDNIDTASISNPASVNMSEGFVCLHASEKIRRTEGAEILDPENLKSNHKEALPGNMFVAYKTNSNIAERVRDKLDSPESSGEEWDLEWNRDNKTNLDAIFDGQDNTWFEFQMINIPEKEKLPSGRTQGHGLHWKDGLEIYHGDRESDHLTLTLVVKLKEATTLNWIHFQPYLPPRSDIKYRVDYVGTSLTNSSDYIPVSSDFENSYVIIGGDSQVADLDFKDREKYTGHGIWTFPTRKAQYIKFEITCESPYDENIAHLYWTVTYETTTTKRRLFGKTVTTTETTERIPGPLPEKGEITAKHLGVEGAIAGAVGVAVGVKAGVIAGSFAGPIGMLIGAGLGFLFGSLFGTKTEVTRVDDPEPGLDVYSGWRWLIGIRELNAYAHKYDRSSTLLTKNLISTKPIGEVSLSVSEFIPEEFYAKDLSTKNQWIRYSLSLDDGKTWHRISPLEHKPVGGEGEVFPNKIISATPNISPEAQTEGKTYVNPEGDVRSIRLMAEFSRPEDIEDMTPILYDYELRILPKEDEE